MSKRVRTPALYGFYHQYLADQQAQTFCETVSAKYTVGTLERLTVMGDRMVRRAAALALGLLADFESNAILGRALHDDDRGVRMLAESGIRKLWCRAGNSQQRKQLESLMALNAGGKFAKAIELATAVLQNDRTLAECWNQRAVALFGLGRYGESIQDCKQVLELNPYHFGAATGMGQCQLQLGNRSTALDCFRRALKLNPNLEGVRAHVLYLQRTLKSQE